MSDCETRDVSQYDEYCETHKQDASLCHLLNDEKPKSKSKKDLVMYEQLDEYPLEFEER